MDFISKINATFTSTTNMVRQKAGDLAEIAKLNSQISTLENQQQVLFSELGKTCYEKCLQDPIPGFSDAVTQLQEIEKRLEELRRQIQEIKEIRESKTCPQCGAVLEKDAVFCSSCGARADQPAVSTATTKKCAFCGADIDADDVFCASCGKKQP